MEHRTQQVPDKKVTVPKGQTVYSDPFESGRDIGFWAALLQKAGAGSVVITLQCGLTADGTFYDPLNSSRNEIGKVFILDPGDKEQYVEFSPVLAPWSRYKMVEQDVADTVVTVKTVQKL